MMLPNQINNQRFSTVGKGGYRASEVDAFIQRVFQNYNKLYNENNILKERLTAITPLIDEYNENKKSIADALIWAKSTSDKTVEQANQQAKDIIDGATAEGDKIIADKKSEAQAVYAQELSSTKTALETAKSELEITRSQAKSYSERYIAEINAKAKSIIEDANMNASQIVADAYKDAQTARDKADAIISKANEDLVGLKEQATKLKADIEKAVKIASESVVEFSFGDIESETDADAEIIKAKQIDMDEIEEFTFDFVNESAVDAGETEVDTVEEFKPTFVVETVVDEEVVDFETEPTKAKEDFISGGSTAATMPDVSAYISKIFDSAGSEDTDFSSFADGLNDAFAHSLEESDISFDDLKIVMENSIEGKAGTDEE